MDSPSGVPTPNGAVAPHVPLSEGGCRLSSKEVTRLGSSPASRRESTSALQIAFSGRSSSPTGAVGGYLESAAHGTGCVRQMAACVLLVLQHRL